MKVNKCVLFPILVILLHTIAWMFQLLTNAPIAEDNNIVKEYDIQEELTSLGDLSTYSVKVDGKDYILVRVQGEPDELVPIDEYYAADPEEVYEE